MALSVWLASDEMSSLVLQTRDEHPAIVKTGTSEATAGQILVAFYLFVVLLKCAEQ